MMKIFMPLLKMIVPTFLLTGFYSSASTTNTDIFTRYDIDVPFNISQPILPVNLLDNIGNELVVIGSDKEHRWLAIYAFSTETNQYILYEKHRVPSKYFAYDISDRENDSKKDLYFLARDEVVYFKSLQEQSDDNETDLPKSVFLSKQAVTSMFIVEEATYLGHRDFIKDLNNDGADDIILPGFEHLNLWLSNNCGQLHSQTLPIKSFIKLNDNSVTFNENKLYFADFNFDGKDDIAMVNQGIIEYYPQVILGMFAKESKQIALNSAISGLNWWNITEADGENTDQSQLSHKMVEKIQDINGDGIVDVVVRFTQSSGVLDRTNDYEFYFGNKELITSAETEQSVLVFQQSPNTVIKADGTLSGLKIVDINHDNKAEILLSSFELSLSNIIGALISGGIDQDVMLFSMDTGDKFGDQPFTSKEVELTFSLSKGSSGEPVVILGDVNGDGLQDLLLSDNEALKVYLGKHEGNKFAKKALTQKITVPQNGGNMQGYDINIDGKQDFVMHYGRLDNAEMINQFTLLLAN